MQVSGSLVIMKSHHLMRHSIFMVLALLQAGFEVLGDTNLVLKLPGRVLRMSEKVRGLPENPGERSEAA